MKLYWICGLILIFLMTILIGLSTFSYGEIYDVDINGDGDFTTLDEAISVAEDNDIINVWEGNHSINSLEVLSNISIIGSDKYNTNITARNDSIIHTSGNFSLLSNFTLSNVIIIISGSSNEIRDVLFFNSYLQIIGTENSIKNVEFKLERIEYLSGLSLFSKANLSNVTINDKPIYYLYNSHFSDLNPFIIDRNASAIFLFNTSNIKIENNNFINGVAIFASNSRNIIITNNIFRDSFYGILLANCNDIQIHTNIIQSVYQGVTINANETYFHNNTLINNTIGVLISPGDGYNNIIENNQFIDSPYQIDEINNIIKNNTINGKLSIRMMNFHGTEKNPLIVSENCSSINFENCSNIIIDNTSIISDETGISLKDCDNILIINCKIQLNLTDNGHYPDSAGLLIRNSTFIAMRSNIIHNYYYGVYFIGSRHNLLSNNSILNNFIGVSITSKSIMNTLISNKISSYHTSVITIPDGNNTIGDNSFIGKNIELYKGNEIKNNTFNGRQILYYDQLNNVSINPSTNPYNIAMVLIYSCSNVNINNVTIENGINGIYIEWSKNITIKNSIIFNHTNAGIEFRRNLNTTIQNNVITHNSDFGIILRLCTNSIINNNRIMNNTHGIIVENSESYRIKIENKIISNEIVNNSESGIFIENFGDFNAIQYNVISYNKIGINLTHYSLLLEHDQDFNVINYNQIMNNSLYGLHYTGSTEINAFSDNWWGDKSGPYQHEFNPKGKGNEVKGNIHVNPWMPNPNELSSSDNDEVPFTVKICYALMIIFVIIFLIFTYSAWMDTSNEERKKE